MGWHNSTALISKISSLTRRLWVQIPPPSKHIIKQESKNAYLFFHIIKRFRVYLNVTLHNFKVNFIASRNNYSACPIKDLSVKNQLSRSVRKLVVDCNSFGKTMIVAQKQKRTIAKVKLKIYSEMIEICLFS